MEAACFVLWFCAFSHRAIEVRWSIFALLVVVFGFDWWFGCLQDYLMSALVGLVWALVALVPGGWCIEW